MNASDAALWRSVLFVPGDRPERFSKAAGSGADAVILDLEDAVAPRAKSRAREEVLRYLTDATPGRAALVLRVNGLRTVDGLRDLVALAAADARPDAIMIPKCESAGEIAIVTAIAGAARELVVVPLVETARGLAAVERLAQADARVGGLMFGGVDLAGELRAEASWEPLLYARSRVVAAAAARGLAALDVPSFAIDDLAQVERDALAARRLGFTGKTAIHPRHVAPIHAAFVPDAEAVAAARATLAAVARGGVSVVGGRMTDNAMLRGARRTLELFERGSS